ncbi:hypothetical protein AAFX24_28135 [Vibrio mediterranei]|uniref:hypothetical protein n=1 Tax=Vibrio mediterranei TaxID=689 RepID=UPI0038CF0311
MNVTIRPKDILEHIVTHTLGTAIEDELGSGYYGDAFLLEDGNVAKLTRSMTEGIYAARLLGQSHPNLVNIHSVHCLDYADSKQFLIVQEFVNTDHPLVEEANNSMDLIMERGHSIYEYFDFNDLDTDEQEILQSHGFQKSLVEDVQDGLYFHQAMGNLATDANPSNIGVKTVGDRITIALFDQMNQALERSISKVDFRLEDYLQEDVLAKINHISIADVRASITNAAYMEEYDNEKVNAQVEALWQTNHIP